MLVAGGYADGLLADAELYDPSTGTWSATGALNTARYQHTATLLADGRVLVAAGWGEGVLSSTEFYDPSTESWSATGALNTARASQTATLLADGRVLVAGGGIGNSVAIASAELYDPSTGTWSATGALDTTRYSHTATLLADGRVLVVGGFGGGYHASAELYDRGLGFIPAWRPLISSVPSKVKPGDTISLTGTRFKGISEASGGATNNSASNFPIVQLRRIDNEAIHYLQSNAAGWTDTKFVSKPLTSFQNGPALLTVITNGLPSVSKVVLMMGYGEEWICFPVKASNGKIVMICM